MCELLGISSLEEVPCNDLLQAFFSHATEHPDGWGIARFFQGGASIEKEPLSALNSAYLKTRLTDTITERVLLAHIRKASVGSLKYLNSHPFAQRDRSGRLWTLIHNGTIFESDVLEPYKLRQKGECDSERILLYLIDQIDAGEEARGRALSAEERFAVVDGVLHTVTPKNKVNMLVYDGELFYAHTNHRKSLHLWQRPGTLAVSTQPLNGEDWQEAPMNTLLAYRDGTLAYTGTPHGNEYIKPEDAAKAADAEKSAE